MTLALSGLLDSDCPHSETNRIAIPDSSDDVNDGDAFHQSGGQPVRLSKGAIGLPIAARAAGARQSPA